MFLDLVFLVFMILAVFKGYSRGMIVALFSIFAFIAGIAAAMKLSTTVAAWLGDNVHVSSRWLPVISFLVVFIGVVILVRIGAKFIEKTMDLVMLGWLNRVGGMLLYILLYSIHLSVVVFYASQVKLISDETLAASASWPFIQPLGPWAMGTLGKLVPFFKDMFGDLQNFFSQIGTKKG
jgi:membrane protein required for colicin V production